MLQSPCSAAALRRASALVLILALTACSEGPHEQGWVSKAETWPNSAASKIALEACAATAPQGVEDCMTAKGWRYVDFVMAGQPYAFPSLYF